MTRPLGGESKDCLMYCVIEQCVRVFPSNFQLLPLAIAAVSLEARTPGTVGEPLVVPWLGRVSGGWIETEEFASALLCHAYFLHSISFLGCVSSKCSIVHSLNKCRYKSINICPFTYVQVEMTHMHPNKKCHSNRCTCQIHFMPLKNLSHQNDTQA